MDGVRAFMPPQGILVIAAYLPAKWQVRLIDENIRRASDADFAWADAVFVSGMHVQKAEIVGIAHRAHAFGKACALGGPSVSACPDEYPEFDYLHLGEIGDATDALIHALDDDPTPLAEQRRLQTDERLPLGDFPIPAYELIEGRRYFLGSIQFSSGCPYQCEFCDIPSAVRPPAAAQEAGADYRRTRRDARRRDQRLGLFRRRQFHRQQEGGARIAAASDCLAEGARLSAAVVVRGDAQHCDVPRHSRNDARGGFYAVFCGIETPELGALEAIRKTHNRVMPLFEAVETINSYGIEVVSGIILGLDTDTPTTAANLVEFIDRSHIPVLTINLLQALPKTPLWDRLAATGRLTFEPDRDSNVVFVRPYGDVLDSWRTAIRHAYTPEAIFARFSWNSRRTYPNRKPLPVTSRPPQRPQSAPGRDDHRQAHRDDRTVRRLPPHLLAVCL